MHFFFVFCLMQKLMELVNFANYRYIYSKARYETSVTNGLFNQIEVLNS